MKGYLLATVTTASAAAIAAAWLSEPTGWLASTLAAMAAAGVMMRAAIKNILAISYRKKLYDLPGGRRIHTTPTPRLGGLAFAPIVCCVTILALALHSFSSPSHHLDIPNCLTWICALIFIHMTGVVDDIVGVRYGVKFAAQIVAAVLVVASGFWIDNLGGLFGVGDLSPWVGMPLTVLFIVGVVNALNLIDGMNGLAAGLCLLALSVYGVNCFLTGRYFLALAAGGAIGTLLPFFWCNVRGMGKGRHKLFMGDTGSQTLGLIVSVLAVGQMMKGGTELATHDYALALSPLLVPVFDVVHVMFFRIARGKHPFHPDTTHIHHRLTEAGFTPRGAVVTIVCSAAGVTALNMVLAPLAGLTLTLLVDVAAWCVLNTFLLTRKKLNKNLNY